MLSSLIIMLSGMIILLSGMIIMWSSMIIMLRGIIIMLGSSCQLFQIKKLFFINVSKKNRLKSAIGWKQILLDIWHLLTVLGVIYLMGYLHLHQCVHSYVSTHWGLSFTRICLHYRVLCFTWTCLLCRSLTCTWTDPFWTKPLRFFFDLAWFRTNLFALLRSCQVLD